LFVFFFFSVLDDNQKEIVQKLIAGDYSAIPGLDESQQASLSSLLSGDLTSIVSNFQSNFLNNPEIFESLRQQLLSTGPEVTDTLAQLGLSTELLENPKKFQSEVQGKVNQLFDTMMSGLQQQQSGNEEELIEEEEAISKKGKKNTKGNARRDARRFVA